MEADIALKYFHNGLPLSVLPSLHSYTREVCTEKDRAALYIIIENSSFKSMMQIVMKAH